MYTLEELLAILATAAAEYPELRDKVVTIEAGPEDELMFSKRTYIAYDGASGTNITFVIVAK
jgi:hypothetical protein